MEGLNTHKVKMNYILKKGNAGCQNEYMNIWKNRQLWKENKIGFEAQCTNKTDNE